MVVLGCVYFYPITPHLSSAPSESAVGLLERADELSWGKQVGGSAAALCESGHLFEVQNQPSEALYAQVGALAIKLHHYELGNPS